MLDRVKIKQQAETIAEHFRESIGTKIPGEYRVFQGNDVPRIIGSDSGQAVVADLATMLIADRRVRVETIDRASDEGWLVRVLSTNHFCRGCGTDQDVLDGYCIRCEHNKDDR